MNAEAATFPLVPRWRPAGSLFGRLQTSRRGSGTSVAGNRPYQTGDDPGAIDWKTSARLSSLRGTDEFIVREHFADEAPRTVVVGDRRPSMSLYPEELPWLPKPAAARAVWEAIAGTTVQELGVAGWLDMGGERPAWFAPSAAGTLWRVHERLDEAPFDATDDSLEDAFAYLVRVRRSLPAGTFVFVCSDFLRPLPTRWWLRALALRWDVVPVVVQDPDWERSFPQLDGLVVPFAEAREGRTRKVRLRRGDSAERRAANEERFATLLGEFHRLSLDAVIVDKAEPAEVLAALSAWGEARLAVRRGEW